MEHLIFLNNLPLDSVLERALKATKHATDPNKWLVNDEVITVSSGNTWHSNKDVNIYRGAIELAEHYIAKKTNNKIDEEDPFSTPYHLALNLLKQAFEPEYLAVKKREQESIKNFVSPLDSNSAFIRQKNEIISLLNIEDPELISLLDVKLNQLTQTGIKEVIDTVGVYKGNFVADDGEGFAPPYEDYGHSYSNNAGLEQFLKDNFLPPKSENKLKFK